MKEEGEVKKRKRGKISFLLRAIFVDTNLGHNNF